MPWHEILNWIVAQAESLWLLLPVTALVVMVLRFASTYWMERLREGRARKADQKKAASEFVYVADAFRRYWVKRYYADQNQQPDPDPESSVVWSGDDFDPLLTPERQSLFSRLSKPLQNRAYALDHMVREAKENIATLAEFDEDQIDYDAPVHVCEIAIASDELWRAVLNEMGLSPPAMYDAISDIRSGLDKSRADKQKAADERQRFNEEFWSKHAPKD